MQLFFAAVFDLGRRCFVLRDWSLGLRYALWGIRQEYTVAVEEMMLRRLDSMKHGSWIIEDGSRSLIHSESNYI
jgi:hypothetical protein